MITQKWCDAFTVAMGIEGGEYDHDSSDSGSFTTEANGYSSGRFLGSKWGMTADDLEKVLRRECIPEDMKNCTKETAMIHYKPEYWDKLRGEEINNQWVVNKIFANGLNIGIVTEIKIIQESYGVPITGVMDDTTIKAINS